MLTYLHLEFRQTSINSILANKKIKQRTKLTCINFFETSFNRNKGSKTKINLRKIPARLPHFQLVKVARKQKLLTDTLS